MNINIKDIQALRTNTGAGIVDCKNALSEANGDLDLAKDLLRKKGIAAASKKLDREANEGLIGIRQKDNLCALLEINSETDFVANNSFFQEFFQNVLDLILQNPNVDNLDALMKLHCEWCNDSLENATKNIIGVMKENVKIHRFKVIRCRDSEKVFYYLHNKIADNLGKLGVALLVRINDEQNQDLTDVSKKICMHIASNEVFAITKERLDENFVQKEKNLLHEEMKNTNKPANIIEKIIEGKISKLYEKYVLLEQRFFLDEKITIHDLMIDSNMEVLDFVKFKIK